LIEWLTGPYAYDFMQRAMVAALIVGALAPAVGVWIVLRRMAYLGDAMSHATLGGVAVAYLLGASLVIGALAAGLVMAAIMSLLAVQPKLREDAVIGIAQVTLFAAGLMIIAKADTGAIDLSHLLLGSITTVSAEDLRVDLLLGGTCALLLAFIFDDLRTATLDPEHAKTVGVRVNLLRAALLTILAIVVVLSLQTVGLLLSVALLVVPAATARLWTRTVLQMTFVATAIGMGSTFVGLTASWHADTPPGATIALVCVAVLVVSLVATLPRRATATDDHLPIRKNRIGGL